MKQYLKRSAAWLLCLAMVLGLFAGVPGAVISKVSAEETEGTETSENVEKPSYKFTLDGMTSLTDLEKAGWGFFGKEIAVKVFSVATIDGDTVLVWDNTEPKVEYGSMGMLTPVFDVPAGATYEFSMDINTQEGAMLYFYEYGADGTQVAVTTLTSEPTNGEWLRFAKRIVVNKDTVTARLMVYDSAGNAAEERPDNRGYMLVDNMAATPVAQSLVTSNPNGITNGNHASGLTTYPFATMEEAGANFERETLSTLQSKGWSGSSLCVDYDATRNSRVMKVSSTGTSSTFAPMIKVQGLGKIYYRFNASVSDDNLTDTTPNLAVYSYFYDANGVCVGMSSTGDMRNKALDGQWVAYSSVDVAVPASAVYVVPMFYLRGIICMDNIQLLKVPAIEAVSPEINETFDATDLTQKDLELQGWRFPTAQYCSFGVVTQQGNQILALKSHANDPVYAYTGYMPVGEATTLYFSAEGMADKNVGVYIRFFDASFVYLQKQVVVSTNGTAARPASNGNWVGWSMEVAVPTDVDAVYAAVMLDFQTKNTGIYYYDNISLSATHTAHNFAEASDVVAVGGDCNTATTYYGECECGAVSHVKTVTVEAPGHTDTDPKDHMCDTCGTRISECRDDSPKDHKCDTCDRVMSSCKEEDPKDHVCDICGKSVGEHADGTDANHTCDYCEKAVDGEECVDEGRDHVCDECTEPVGEHKQADKKHICDYCQEVMTSCDDYWEAGEYVKPTFDSNGYTPYTCSVCGDTKEVYDEGTKLEAVAKIGDDRFETLAAAYEAAQTGDTIVLLADIDLGAEMFTVKKQITIDLNGNDITSSYVGAYAGIYVGTTGDLTITGEGTITAADVAIGNYGDVTINGGVITGEYAALYNYYAGATTYGTATIAGGELNIVWNTGDLTVTGGTIAYVDNTHKLAVTGGTITELEITEADYAPVNGTTTTVTGGTVTNVIAVAKIGNAYYATVADAFEAAEAGATITLLADATIEADATLAAGVTYEIPAGLTLTVSEGVTVTADAAAKLNCAGTIVVAGKADISKLVYGQIGEATFGACGGKLVIKSTGTVVMLTAWEGIWTPVNNVGGMLQSSETGAKVTVGAQQWLLTEAGWAHQNHVYGEGVVTTDPTCEDEGVMTFTCTALDCGCTKTETVPTGGHSYTNTADSTCNVCGEKRSYDEVTPIVDSSLNIQKHNIDMTSNLSLGFRVEKSAIANVADYYVKLFKAEGKLVQNNTITIKDIAPASNGNYYAYYPVPACEMSDVVEAVLYVVDADGIVRCSQVDRYSVKDYLYLALSSYHNSTDPKKVAQATIAVELLYYGAEAQTIFDHKANDLVTADLVNYPEYEALRLKDAPNPVNHRNWGANNGEVVFTSSNVELQEKINNLIKIDVSKLTSADRSELVAVVKNQETGEVLQTITFEEFNTIEGAPNQYYVPITQIPPAYMRNIYTIEIFAGETVVSSVATYSVESYVRLAIDKNNRFAPVALAGLRYGIAVAAFAAQYNQ